jgi:hypothetical protein
LEKHLVFEFNIFRPRTRRLLFEWSAAPLSLRCDVKSCCLLQLYVTSHVRLVVLRHAPRVRNLFPRPRSPSILLIDNNYGQNVKTLLRRNNKNNNNNNYNIIFSRTGDISTRALVYDI